jgi:hypothetical protein
LPIADKLTRRKRSCVMRYAALYKSDSEPLDQFMGRKGGINAGFPAVPGAISWRRPLVVDRHLDKAFYVASRFEDSNLK